MAETSLFADMLADRVPRGIRIVARYYEKRPKRPVAFLIENRAGSQVLLGANFAYLVH